MTALALPTRPPVVLRAAQALLGLLGGGGVFGSIYFSVVAPPQAVHGADWLVAAWALLTGSAFLALATRLGTGDERVRRAATGLVTLHVAFGLVKLVAYDEQAALGFMVLDAVLIGLLSLPAVRRYCAGG